MASCFWHFLTMHRKMKFSSGVIHRLLLRELHHNGPTDEIQFMLLGNKSVRFSKYRTRAYAEVENDIHHLYFPRVNEVSLEEIRVVVTVGEFGKVYDAVNLFLIYMLNWILMGLDERFKIPVWQFRLGEDLDTFNAFPWGSHVYRHSIYSFKYAFEERRDRFELRQQEKGAHVHIVETYNIYGLSYAILIFAFKVIPDLGQQFSTQRVTDLSPRILKWELTKQPRGKKLAKIFKAMASWEDLLNDVSEAFRKSEEDQKRQHLELVDMIQKSDEDRQQQYRVLLDTIQGLQGSTTYTQRDGPPPPNPDFSNEDMTDEYRGDR
ncbi:hypothetical protein Ddye_023795 [Dipteronia dyeriana]|uniref:Phospholipase-like protein n=1 Tax=Dipteronia dyeriana TaxID=168575 RepID=A0AAD9WTN2_9ROSI|nr:hypothetical protein Ddye_023795 [Dipteronia dyeriana]